MCNDTERMRQLLVASDIELTDTLLEVVMRSADPHRLYSFRKTFAVWRIIKHGHRAVLPARIQYRFQSVYNTSASQGVDRFNWRLG